MSDSRVWDHEEIICGGLVKTSGEDLQDYVRGEKFATILADPPWRFNNRTGKVAPEHKRLLRYPTMTLEEIKELPIPQIALPQSHLYLWVPNALIAEGLEVMKRWGFTYKTNLVWYKIRKDGGPDGRGVGFYFRNVTELVLFGVRGSMRTLQPGRRQVNIIRSRKREHSRKPDELYDIIEDCSPGPYLELFARHRRENWYQWGNEMVEMEKGEVGVSGANWLREQAKECYRLAVARGKYPKGWTAVNGGGQIADEIDEWEAYVNIGDADGQKAEYGDILHAVLSVGHAMGYDVASELEKAQERNRRRAS